MTDTEANAAPEAIAPNAMILSYQPAQNRGLSTALVGLESQIEAAARANLQIVLDQDPSYSETEQQAMLVIEELRQVNGLDLTAVLLRAKYLHIIEQNNLIARHPAGYQSMQEMASKQGISISELSQTLDLANIVFPYVENTLHIPIAVLWEEIGKGNMRELVPVLKTIITGQPSPTGTVNASAERILEDVAIDLRNAGRDLTGADDAELRQRAVTQLLQDGALLTNRELRTRIRPERTPSINMTIARVNGHRVIVAEASEEQVSLLMRRMGAYIDPHVYEVNEDPDLRQQQLMRIPEFRRISDLMRGT
jgi:hypothetical protein